VGCSRLSNCSNRVTTDPWGTFEGLRCLQRGVVKDAAKTNLPRMERLNKAAHAITWLLSDGKGTDNTASTGYEALQTQFRKTSAAQTHACNQERRRQAQTRRGSTHACAHTRAHIRSLSLSLSLSHTHTSVQHAQENGRLQRPQSLKPYNIHNTSQHITTHHNTSQHITTPTNQPTNQPTNYPTNTTYNTTQPPPTTTTTTTTTTQHNTTQHNIPTNDDDDDDDDDDTTTTTSKQRSNKQTKIGGRRRRRKEGRKEGRKAGRLRVRCGERRGQATHNTAAADWLTD